MMRHWHFYHRDTGVFSTGSYSSSDDRFLARNTPENHVAFEGYFDHSKQRIDIETGGVIDYIPQSNSEEIAASIRQLAQLQIARLEQQQLRSMRELALDPANQEAKSKLVEIDSRIAALRADINR